MNIPLRFLFVDAVLGHAADYRDTGRSKGVLLVQAGDRFQNAGEVARGEPGQGSGDLAAFGAQPHQERLQAGMDGVGELLWLAVRALFPEGDRPLVEVDLIHWDLGRGQPAALVNPDLECDLHPIGRAAHLTAPLQFIANHGDLLVGECGLALRDVAGNVVPQLETRVALAITPLDRLAHESGKNADIVKGGVAGNFFPGLLLDLVFPPNYEVDDMLVFQQARDEEFTVAQELAEVLPSPKIAGEGLDLVLAAVTHHQPFLRPIVEAFDFVRGDRGAAFVARAGVGVSLGFRLGGLDARGLVNLSSELGGDVGNVPTGTAGTIVNRDALHVYLVLLDTECQKLSEETPTQIGGLLSNPINSVRLIWSSSLSWFEPMSGSSLLTNELRRVSERVSEELKALLTEWSGENADGRKMKRFLLLSAISVLGLTSAWTIWQNQFVRFTPASIEALAAMPAGQVQWRDMEFWIQRKNRPTP